MCTVLCIKLYYLFADVVDELSQPIKYQSAVEKRAEAICRIFDFEEVLMNTTVFFRMGSMKRSLGLNFARLRAFFTEKVVYYSWHRVLVKHFCAPFFCLLCIDFF